MRPQTLFGFDDETLTVGALNRRLTEVVGRAFPSELWVQGQIRNLSRSARGHVYFDLVDPVESGAAPKTSIAVTLFDANRQVVNRALKRAGNAVRIDDGVEVRVRAGLEYYMPRGQVQLNMKSIDPEFTLGRLGADRERLLAELTAKGLIDANGELSMPMVPLGVGLVTSHNSAAEADFCSALQSSGYPFFVSSIATRVQGGFAGEEIAAAISHAQSLDCDVIALVRGGGAKTDLAAFDTEAVAVAIAQSRLPVVCGIGHEIDTTVADLVSHTSLKTPTACAQYLIERVVDFDFSLTERTRALLRLAERVPMAAQANLNDVAQQLFQTAGMALAVASRQNLATAAELQRRAVSAIAVAERRISGTCERTATKATRTLARAIERTNRSVMGLQTVPAKLREMSLKLDVREAGLAGRDPRNALARGYSITTDVDGRVVKSVSKVAVGEAIVTLVVDGEIMSTVSASSPRPEGPVAEVDPS